MTSPFLGIRSSSAFQSRGAEIANEILRGLEAAISIDVVDQDLTAPPATPVELNRYIIPAGATGDWANQTGTVAFFRAGRWRFMTPRKGWIVYVVDENKKYKWNGTIWVEFVLGGSFAAAGISYDNMYSMRPVDTIQEAIDQFSAEIDDLMGAGGCPTTLEEAILVDTPTGYWKCEETSGPELLDSSGNGFHLDLIGTYTLAKAPLLPKAPTKKYLYLSAVNNSGGIDQGTPETLGLSFPYLSDHTWEAVICSFSNTTTLIIAGITGDPTNETSAHNAQSGLQISSGTLQMFWEHAAGTNDTLSCTPDLLEGKVYHIVVTRVASSGLVEFWINGVFCGSGTDADDPTDGSAAEFRLGHNLGQSTFNGILGHVAFYHNKILSDTRIAAHADAFSNGG